MEANEKNGQRLVKIPEKGLLSLVSAKLKDRDLFPKKTKAAKDYLKRVTAFPS